MSEVRNAALAAVVGGDIRAIRQVQGLQTAAIEAVQQTAGAGLEAASEATNKAFVAKIAAGITPMDFGAAGDRAIDDTASLLAAMSAAATNGLELNGAGRTFRVASLALPPATLRDARLLVAPGTTSLGTISGAGQARLIGCEIDGNGTSAVLAFAGTANPVLENCEVHGFAGGASHRPLVFDQDVTGLRISGCTFRDMQVGDALVVKSRGSTIYGNVFARLGATAHGIRLGRFLADTAELSGEDTTISGNVFEDIYNDPINCELNSAFVSIVGNTFRRCRNICKVDFTDNSDALLRGVLVEGNVFSEPRGTAFVRGVSGQSCRHISVIGNDFDFTGSIVDGVPATADTAILLGGPDMVVSGNRIRGPHTTSVRVGAGSTVSGNRARDFTTRAVMVDDGSRSTVIGNSCDSTVTGATGVQIAGGNGATVSANAISLLNGIGIRSLAAASRVNVNGNVVLTAGTPISLAGTGDVQANNITA